MWELEIKILLLTLVYFVGWFLFEKLFSTIWKTATGANKRSALRPRRKIKPLASVTPVDQTWRYIKGLESPDWRVRKISCVQLGERRGTIVVEALIKALDDNREEVSIAAGEALAKIGDPYAIDALSRHCESLERTSTSSYESYIAA